MVKRTKLKNYFPFKLFLMQVMAAVDNIKDKDYTVKAGDRLVQAVAFNG